jgi:hypothetical protein
VPSFQLDPQLTDVLAIAGCAAGVLALLFGLLAHLRVRRLRRAWRTLVGEGGEGNAEDIVSSINRKVAEVEQLRLEVTALREQSEATRNELSDAIRHVAVVRYDAFGDMGGRLSFSAAMLDDSGDGIVLTSINGRSETRTYAKGVKSGGSEHPLSPEEEQAVAFARRGAVNGARRPVPAQR